MLVSGDGRSGQEDFRSLPYLVTTHEVSYANSATLLFSRKGKRARFANRLLAFASDYRSQEGEQTVSRSRQLYTDNLLPIPGARDEVIGIRKIIRGMTYLGEESNEANFKKHAGNYDIIHLAMHGYLDNENPMLSKLIFSIHPDSVEDNLLNTAEIYNLRLKARLATLSSCKSGMGTLSGGEGVISLARGFSYAGCPCIVMSLWEVEDNVSADIMTCFYKKLRQGCSKQKAMAYAKRTFLRKTEPVKTHPYYWACYVVIGDTHPVFVPHFLKYMAMALLVLVTVVWWVMRRRRAIIR